jgi:hypothetical protein
MRKSKYTDSEKLTAVWRMKEIVYGKTKGMDAGDFFQYVNNASKNISSKTGAKPAGSTVRFGKKRVA